jgi:uncharacterized protein YkwD
VPTSRPHTIVAVALTALTFAAPAAAAHHNPDPIAHIAVATRTCANANTPATNATKQAMRKAVVCLINKQRTAHHLPALKEQSQLDRSAQGWTNTMVARNVFTHGTSFSSRITAAGYDWQTAGENIASGFATPQDVVTAWMGDPGHCQNILNPEYASVGTGVSPKAIRSVASGSGTWTQDFGLAMTQSAPSHNWAPADHCPYY